MIKLSGYSARTAGTGAKDFSLKLSQRHYVSQTSMIVITMTEIFTTSKAFRTLILNSIFNKCTVLI